MRNLYFFALLAVFQLINLSLKSQNQLFIPDTISGASIQLNLQTGNKTFYGNNLTSTMGVNGNFLAPTIILRKNQQVTLNVTNNLNEPTTIHWHGLHVAPENDGGPHVIIPPSATWSPSFTVLDRASTHWYHPHLHHFTNEHVIKGIAGFIITKDPLEAALNLPRSYGIDDIPLVVQTKQFDTNYQFVAGGALDTTLMVNGTINPFIQLPAQIVRLRLLNGSSERYYNFGLSNNASFHVIASDASLLDAPVSRTRIQIAPGERYEILVNLTGLNGQTLYLKNYGSELPNGIYGATQPGMGAGQTIPNYNLNPRNGGNYNVLQIQVQAPNTNPISTIPSTLISNNTYNEADAQITRTFVLQSMAMGQTAIQGPFTINGAHFDMNIMNFETTLNNTEIWEVRNQSPISHPFHLHGEPFKILSIAGAAPPAHLAGWKDVVHVPAGNTTVRFITRFNDFYNDSIPYMYHCHMLTHEDDGMMGQFLVKNQCDLQFTQQPIDQISAPGFTVTFSVNSNQATASYQWQSDAGFGFQNLSNAGQFSGVNTSILTVSNLTAVNSGQVFRCIITQNNCEETSSTAKIVMNTSIQDIQNHTITVYPIPFKNNLNVYNKNNTIQYLQIINTLGQHISQLQIEPQQIKTYNTQNLSSGIYFLINQNGEAIKIVK